MRVHYPIHDNKMLHSLIILLLASIGLASSESYYIVPTNSSDCVVDHCLTLYQFFTETNSSSNVTLLILEGDHVIDFPISMSGITELLIRPLNDANDESTTITCSDSAQVVFTNIGSIDIRSITFMDCDGTEFESIDQLKITATDFIVEDSSVSTLSIKSSIARMTDTQFLSIALHANIFYQNTIPSFGGAMVVTNSLLEVDNCTFKGNLANYGGAIFANVGSEIQVTYSKFMSNHAEGLIGPYLGGAIFVHGTSTIVINASTFENNTSDLGGALAIVFSTNNTKVGSTHVVEGTTFSNNRANIEGGVLYVNRSYVTFTDCMISYNSAVKSGGAIA